MRGEKTGHRLCRITSSQIVRQWQTFLTKVNNKTSLISFIVNEWRTVRFRQKLGDKELFAMPGALCFRITSQNTAEVPDLQCKGEEADGRFLLHASHAGDKGYSSVTICSEDTGVFIVSVSFADEIGALLFIKCGTRNRTRLMDINRVAASWSGSQQGSC